MSDTQEPKPTAANTPRSEPKVEPLPLPPLRPQPKSMDDVAARLATNQHLRGRPNRKRMTRRAWLALGIIGFGFCAALLIQVHAAAVLIGTGAFVFWGEWTGRGSEQW